MSKQEILKKVKRIRSAIAMLTIELQDLEEKLGEESSSLTPSNLSAEKIKLQMRAAVYQTSFNKKAPAGGRGSK